MARGLCFCSLCAVMAVLVVAPVRSDEIDNFIKREVEHWHSAKNVPAMIVSIVMNMIHQQIFHTFQGFERRLHHLENQELPKIRNSFLSRMNTFESVYGENWNFWVKSHNIFDNAENITALTKSSAIFQSHLINLRRAQQVLTYYLAFDLTITDSLRVELNKMPDSKYLFQAVFSVRLVGGIHSSHEGRVEMEVGNTVGTICDRNGSISIVRVVCRQLGLPWKHLAETYGIRGWRWTFRYLRTRGSILLDEVSCHGHENHLLLCPSSVLFHFDNSYCNRDKDIGVRCDY